MSKKKHVGLYMLKTTFLFVEKIFTNVILKINFAYIEKKS